MRNTIERRLRRLETARCPALPMQAVVIMARDAGDAAQQVVEATHAGRHQPGWPAIIITGMPSVVTGGQIP